MGVTKQDRATARMLIAAEDILENVLLRRNYPVETRDKLAERLEALVNSEIKKRKVGE
jgi:hypothetical protein